MTVGAAHDAAARPYRPIACGIGRHVCNFVALSLLPLAHATAFTFAAPLMVVPLASIVLGEQVRLTRAPAVKVGFLGVLAMLSGQLGQGEARRRE